MAVSTDQMANPHLTPADVEIINVLREGRNNSPNIARETGYSRQYITERLRRMEEHDIVVNIGSGIYELQPENVPEEGEDDE